MRRFQFHPTIARWFEQKFGSPTEPQQLGWPAIQSGAHTLIAAPTGSGKTLAAFLASLDNLFRRGLDGTLKDETLVVYVSPLKALSNDIHKNLEEPLAEIRSALNAECHRDIEIRSAVRTGDTSSSQRQAIARKPPHILVTTPESLYLLLTSESGRRTLSTARTLIVDEIHAVVNNRRGSHLALSIERLAALAREPLQRIGLSATQNPIEDVARFLVGAGSTDRSEHPHCHVVNVGHSRALDLEIELPGSPLEAVMSNEVWTEVYRRLAELIEAHRTTLVFVNTRRLAERVTHHLCQIVGADKVASHHGSLSAKLRLDAENRLKAGQLRALVATASLELGIDIGAVDLVCQLGTTRSIATLLQRVGRAEHRRGGVPKGRLFPLTRDELVETVAALRAVRRGNLDRLHIPDKPLDVLAQQIAAAAGTEDWDEDQLFALVRRAHPYRTLTREEFDEIVKMLSEGFSTKRGRRAALIHRDAVNHRIRARRGARLVALTSGGAIPDNSDYRVVLEPTQTFIGTVNEDFAVESMAGDIFQLGNTSWKIVQILAGTVRVEEARGQPPGIPFWLGEAPARTNELSVAVAELREDVARVLVGVERESNSPDHTARLTEWFMSDFGVSEPSARQLADYFVESWRMLGALPSQDTIVMERFFDESGGMQLVIHSPFGARLNRAWGLALRKRFCRSFNFELQSAATDDAIVLSLGTQHSFPLEDVFRYLNSRTVRELLVQALLDAPMFAIRWRWNAGRALALPRQRGGRKIPPPLQRMESENLLAAIFPDQLACLENIAGDREVPDHPLVRQTIDDCLREAMDIDGLEELLRRIEAGKIQCVARELPEPSPLAHEILNARPYAFLDNAPLEERRTQAVYTRRASDPARDELGILDAAAIERVCEEAWPRATTPDELHDVLLQLGVASEADLELSLAPNPESVAHTESRLNRGVAAGELEAGQGTALRLSTAPLRTTELLDTLVKQRRAGRLSNPDGFWTVAERLHLVRATYPDGELSTRLDPAGDAVSVHPEPHEAVRELLRGRLEICGPVTRDELASHFQLEPRTIETALLALEAEGFILRGKFRPDATAIEWCDRRLLARIHRLTLNRLRAEIQPVSIADFMRFLFAWQHVAPEHRAEGPEGVSAVVQQLDGCEAPAGAWEPVVLSARIQKYTPEWLDRLCFTGQMGWGRLSPPQSPGSRGFTPLRSSPIALFERAHLNDWIALTQPVESDDFSPDTNRVLQALSEGGALFFGEIVARTGLLQSRVEQALGELAARGRVTADSFEGLRALLLPAEKRAPLGDVHRKRRHKTVSSVEFAGRWTVLRRQDPRASTANGAQRNGLSTGPHQESIERLAWTLLRRYGVVFRKLIEREAFRVSWFDLSRVYRRLEARGEIRGGYFVSGASGEQFALPEAVGSLRSIRKSDRTGDLIVLGAADPLNLSGILTPGPRVAALTGNRILFRDGVPVAALVSREIQKLNGESGLEPQEIERALRVGRLAPAIRRYYA